MRRKLKPKKINKITNNYPVRLYKCIERTEGRAIKY